MLVQEAKFIYPLLKESEDTGQGLVVLHNWRVSSQEESSLSLNLCKNFWRLWSYSDFMLMVSIISSRNIRGKIVIQPEHLDDWAVAHVISIHFSKGWKQVGIFTMPNSSWWTSIKTEFKRGLELTPKFRGIDDISQHSTLVILITDSETYIFIKWSFFIINLRLGSVYWYCGHEIKSWTMEL